MACGRAGSPEVCTEGKPGGSAQGQVMKTGMNVVSHRETQRETGPEEDVHAVRKNKAEPTPHGPKILSIYYLLFYRKSLSTSGWNTEDLENQEEKLT